jgi:type I restriction enzyme M protein
MALPQPTNGNAKGSNFISSGLRQKIDQLMDILWSGGVNNPMDSIEQLSYLIFLRLLSEQDEIRASLDKKYTRIFSGKWARYAWGNFVTLTGDGLFSVVRDAIENFHDLPGLSETGKLLYSRATLKIYERSTLRAVIQGIHEMDLAAHDGVDIKGDMYEYLLSKLAQSGTNGQFRTPRHIIDLMVALVDPKPNQRICDPACGTAGFLISAYNHILKNNTKPADIARGTVDGSLLKPSQWKFIEEHAFTGYDNDANMVKIAILNLYLHQLEKAHIELHNPLTTTRSGQYPGQLYDIVLANPPFSGKVQDESILADLNHKLSTRATELLFLKWFIDHLTPNGRAGVIVPSGVLSGSTNAARNIRKMLLDDCDLQAVITMPSGVFKPYAGVATAILIFQKGASTKSVWFYEMTADGFSLSDTRTPIADNDIPDILQQWQNREEGVHSFRVSRSELAEYGDELTPGRYRKQHVVMVEHDSPQKIIADILHAEEGIAGRLHGLQKKLSRK